MLIPKGQHFIFRNCLGPRKKICPYLKGGKSTPHLRNNFLIDIFCISKIGNQHQNKGLYSVPLPFIEIASKTSTYKAFCVHNNCYL